MKKAFLFSGQGAQYEGMGKELYDTYSCAKEIFDRADEALNFSMTNLCFSGGEELNRTENTQPAILTMSIAVLKVLAEKGVQADFLAGLSLGEYTAYVASGALDFETAVRLVKKRGRFMTEAVPEGKGAMTAVMGLGRQEVLLCCKEASGLGYVAPANYNAPGQIVVAGESAAVEEAARLAKEKGAKMTVPLKVSGPFHTALLEPASQKLAKELEEITFQSMKTPVITNVTGQVVEASEDIKPLLIKQVMSPVQWEDSLMTLSQMGAEAYIEVGPGKALSGFVKRTLKGSLILNVEDIKSLEKTLEKLG